MFWQKSITQESLEPQFIIHENEQVLDRVQKKCVPNLHMSVT